MTNRKGLLLFLLGLCFALSLQPISITAPVYWSVSPGWYFETEGYISFASTVFFSSRYVNDNYAYFNDLRFPGSYVWSSLGFKCSSNANMTIKKAEIYELQYTVNAPVGLESTSNVRLPSARRVQSLTGATSWSQSGSIVTVNVDHESEQDITISWAEILNPSVVNTFIDLQSNARTVFILFGTSLVVLMLGLIMAAYTGGVEIGSTIATIFIAGVSLCVALLVVFMIFSAANL